MGASGDPCGSPDWSKSSTSDVERLTVTPAFLFVQKLCMRLTMISGILLCLALSGTVRPLLPGARSGFAENMAALISVVNALAVSCSFSSWGVGGSGKKFKRSSLTISALSCVSSPSRLLMDAILPKLKVFPGSRYRVSCQIFVESSRNSIQCSFFLFLMIRWSACLAIFVAASSLTSGLPCLFLDLTLFRIIVYSLRSDVRSFVHHLFAFFDGFAFWRCRSTTSSVIPWMQLCIKSKSVVGYGVFCSCCSMCSLMAFESAF